MLFRRERRKEEKEIDRKEEREEESKSKIYGFEIKKDKKQGKLLKIDRLVDLSIFSLIIFKNFYIFFNSFN